MVGILSRFLLGWPISGAFAVSFRECQWPAFRVAIGWGWGMAPTRWISHCWSAEPLKDVIDKCFLTIFNWQVSRNQLTLVKFSLYIGDEILPSYHPGLFHKPLLIRIAIPQAVWNGRSQGLLWMSREILKNPLDLLTGDIDWGDCPLWPCDCYGSLLGNLFFGREGLPLGDAKVGKLLRFGWGNPCGLRKLRGKSV